MAANTCDECGKEFERAVQLRGHANAHSEAHSQAMKGEKNPMYGRSHSEETKQKISEAAQGREHTEETKQKMSEAHKGKTFSEEHKQKIAEAMTGENNPLYGATGSDNPMYGRSHTAESRQKMSEALRGRELSEETKQKISEALKGKMAGSDHPMYGEELSESHKEKLSEAMKGFTHSEETKQKLREMRVGERNPMHGCTGEDNPMYGRTGEDHPHWKENKTHRFGQNWHETREKVLERDGYQCRCCGMSREDHQNAFNTGLSVHHIRPRSEVDNLGRANFLTNLMTLCASCHMNIHQAEQIIEVPLLGGGSRSVRDPAAG